MALRRLCKSGSSGDDKECPAVYVDDEDLAVTVAQGKRLDEAAMGELIDLAADESAVRLPAETLLRAAALYLADRGRPAMMAEVQAFLADQEHAQ